MAFVTVVAGFAAFATVLFSLKSLSDTNRFVPNACTNVATFLPSQVVGQDVAIRKFVVAVCEHVRANQGRATRSSSWGQRDKVAAGASGDEVFAGGLEPPRRPLIMSVHGPPGTGKTFTHTLLARALYNQDPVTATDCPGRSCIGAKVLYGMSYVAAEQENQLERVRDTILEHIRVTPNPLLVIEEYDKLDCPSRDMLRQLLQHPELVNVDLSRAIVLFESNLGHMALTHMLKQVQGNKSMVDFELAERMLRDILMETFGDSDCAQHDEAVAFGATIQHFLPFFPLERADISVLVARELLYKYGRRAAALGGKLVWEPAAVDVIVSKVAVDGKVPLEGASQVAAVCLRSVAQLFLPYELELANPWWDPNSSGRSAAPHAASGLVEFRLVVAPGERELQLLRIEGDFAPFGQQSVYSASTANVSLVVQGARDPTGT